MSGRIFKIEKDADAVLDYSINWSQWLLIDDGLATSEWLAEAGIDVDNDTLNAAVTTVWLSGGTAGQSYTVTNRITTDGGRTDDRSIMVYVTER